MIVGAYIYCLLLQNIAVVCGFQASLSYSPPSRKKFTSCIKAIKEYYCSEDVLLISKSPNVVRGYHSRRSAIAIGASAFVPQLSLPAANAVNNDGTSAIPTWKLDNDVKFPMLALNTAGMSAKETYKAIEYARREGITHIDFHPGSERDGVAMYLSKNNNNKEERDILFLNTKIRKPPIGISPNDAAIVAREQINEDLNILNVRNVDMLMLRDSPDPKVIQSQWTVLVDALAAGMTR